MKKSYVLYIIGVVIATAFIIVACNKNEEVTAPTPQEINQAAFDALKSDIVQLNKDRFKETSMVSTTRMKWWKWLIIGIADVGGSVLPSGGIAAGIAASTLAVKLCNNNIKKDNSQGAFYISVDNTNVALSHVENQAWRNESGYIHNKVISDLYDEYGDDLFNLPEKELLEKANKKVAEITKQTYIPFTIAEEQQSLQAVHQAVDLYGQSTTAESYFGELKTIAPERANEINVIQVAFDELEQAMISEEKAVYVGEVVQHIDAANISMVSKDIIKTGITVANASGNLWTSPTVISNNQN